MGKKFNPAMADKLISQERRNMLPPEKIIDYLQVGQGDVVADLGAGNGYFTIPMAKRTNQSVYAIDIEPVMLNELKKAAEKEEVVNIEYLISGVDKTELTDSTMTRVMMSLVLHEVPNIDKALEEAKRILHPGGQLLLLEWKAIEMESGPPLEERMPSETIVELLKTKGFETEIIEVSSQHYAIKAKLGRKDESQKREEKQ